MENARTLLREIKELDVVINTLQDEIDVIWSRLASVTVKPKEVNVMSSKEDKFPETVDKLYTYEKTIQQQIDNYVDKKKYAKEIIDKMDVTNHKIVLIKYYFQNKTFEKTAEEMDMSYQWICELHTRAINDFEKIAEKM